MIWDNIMTMTQWIPSDLRVFVLAMFASGIIISCFKIVKWIKELILF